MGACRTRTQVGGVVGLELGGAGRAQPAHGLLETGPDRRVERLERLGQGRGGHPDVVLHDPVEPLGVRADRLDPAHPHVVADRADHVQRGLQVGVGARHQGAVVRGAGSGSAEVDPAHHGVSLGTRLRLGL